MPDRRSIYSFRQEFYAWSHGDNLLGLYLIMQLPLYQFTSCTRAPETVLEKSFDHTQVSLDVGILVIGKISASLVFFSFIFA